MHIGGVKATIGGLRRMNIETRNVRTCWCQGSSSPIINFLIYLGSESVNSGFFFLAVISPVVSPSIASHASLFGNCISVKGQKRERERRDFDKKSGSYISTYSDLQITLSTFRPLPVAFLRLPSVLRNLTAEDTKVVVSYPGTYTISVKRKPSLIPSSV